MGNVKNFFKTIKQYKTFNLRLKTIKNRHGEILMDPKDLLNADIPDNSTRRENLYEVEPMVSEVTQEEVNEAI